MPTGIDFWTWVRLPPAPPKNPHSSEWGFLLIGVFNVEKSIRRTIPSANTFFKIISHFKKIVNI